MKKLYDWLTVWEKYTSKQTEDRPPEFLDNTSGVKKRRLKIPRCKLNSGQTPSSSSSAVNISDVQLFDKNMEI